MKLKKVFLISAVLMVGLIYSCEKNMDISPSSELATVENSDALSLEKSAALTATMSSPDMAMKNGNGNGRGNGNVNGHGNDNGNGYGHVNGHGNGNSNLAAVNLGVAGDFVILSKTGITDVYKSDITGDIGASPITGAAILVSCDEVVGTIYSVDAAGPLPCTVTNATRLTTAVGDMQTAYTDAAGRSNPDFLNLGAGNIGGKTLTPGLYKWTSAVVIPTDITISGSSTDVWIFQVAGTLKMSSAVRITLEGGAQAKNVFWVTAGAVTLGTTSHFEGNILSQTGINLQTGTSINGRMLAQTAVTLQMNTVVKP